MSEFRSYEQWKNRKLYREFIGPQGQIDPMGQNPMMPQNPGMGGMGNMGATPQMGMGGQNPMQMGGMEQNPTGMNNGMGGQNPMQMGAAGGQNPATSAGGGQNAPSQQAQAESSPIMALPSNLQNYMRKISTKPYQQIMDLQAKMNQAFQHILNSHRNKNAGKRGVRATAQQALMAKKNWQQNQG